MEGRILSRTPSYDSWSSAGSDMTKAGLSRAMVDDAKWVQAQEERDLKLPRELQRAEERVEPPAVCNLRIFECERVSATRVLVY